MVTDRLYSSWLEPWPGSKLRSVKSGASTSSSVSRSLLTKASSKRRANALFFSCSDNTGAISSLPSHVCLLGRHHHYDATLLPPAHRLEAYSPRYPVGGVLRTSRGNCLKSLMSGPTS